MAKTIVSCRTKDALLLTIDGNLFHTRLVDRGNRDRQRPAGCARGGSAEGVFGEAAVIETGPPTRPSVPGTGPSVLPLTVIFAGVGVRKPNAAGGAALSVLPLGLVA